MRPGCVVCVIILGLMVQGCIELPTTTTGGAHVPIEEQHREIRRIVLERLDPKTGSACKVTYPPDPDMKDLRWMTGADISSCEDVAQQALNAFEASGWVCEMEASPANESLDETGRELRLWQCMRRTT